jgi:hypothetical protein
VLLRWDVAVDLLGSGEVLAIRAGVQGFYNGRVMDDAQAEH